MDINRKYKQCDLLKLEVHKILKISVKYIKRLLSEYQDVNVRPHSFRRSRPGKFSLLHRATTPSRRIS